MQNGDKPRLLLDSVILGIIGGLAAQLFTWMLRLSSRVFLVWLAAYQPPGLPEEGGVLREVRSNWSSRLVVHTHGHNFRWTAIRDPCLRFGARNGRPRH